MRCGPKEALDLNNDRCVSVEKAMKSRSKNAAFVHRCTRSSPANICNKWTGYVMMGKNWALAAGHKGSKNGIMAAAKDGKKQVVFGASKNTRNGRNTVAIGGTDGNKSAMLIGQRGRNGQTRGLMVAQNKRAGKGMMVATNGKKMKAIAYKPCTGEKRPVRDPRTGRCVSEKTAMKRLQEIGKKPMKRTNK